MMDFDRELSSNNNPFVAPQDEPTKTNVWNPQDQASGVVRQDAEKGHLAIYEEQPLTGTLNRRRCYSKRCVALVVMVLCLVATGIGVYFAMTKSVEEETEIADLPSTNPSCTTNCTMAPTYASTSAPTYAPTSTPTNPIYPPPLPFEWNAVGAKIVGPEHAFNFGSPVLLSADGQTMAVGAPHPEAPDGFVRVYQYNNGAWILKGQQLSLPQMSPFHATNVERFGRSLALSADGTTVAVSASHDDATASVHVFSFNATVQQWQMQGQALQGDATHDRFGSALSLSQDGRMLAVGAEGVAGVNHLQALGYVRVFQFVDNNWQPLGDALVGDDPHELFGSSVALSLDGTTLAIAAKYDDGQDGDDIRSGHVQVFEHYGSYWFPMGQSLYGDFEYDRFGRSMALSGDGRTLAVGAADNQAMGRVEVYTFDEEIETWMMIGQELSGRDSFDQFGESVALSHDGTRVAVGASGFDAAEESMGVVRVYEYVAAEALWFRLGRGVLGNDPNDFVGASVSLSANGVLVATGAFSDSIHKPQGDVRVFELSLSNTTK